MATGDSRLAKRQPPAANLLKRLESAADRDSARAEELVSEIDREVKIHSQVKEMFPKARKILGRDELAELGRRIQARKQELQRQ